jgi:hypothetical protein
MLLIKIQQFLENSSCVHVLTVVRKHPLITHSVDQNCTRVESLFTEIRRKLMVTKYRNFTLNIEYV